MKLLNYFKTLLRRYKVIKNKEKLRALNDLYMRCSILDMDYWNNFFKVADIDLTRFVTENTFFKVRYELDHKLAGFIYLSGLRYNPKPGRKPIIYAMVYIKDSYRNWNYATELIEDAIEHLGGVPDDCNVEFPIRYYSKEVLHLVDKFDMKKKTYKKKGIVYIL